MPVHLYFGGGKNSWYGTLRSIYLSTSSCQKSSLQDKNNVNICLFRSYSAANFLLALQRAACSVHLSHRTLHGPVLLFDENLSRFVELFDWASPLQTAYCPTVRWTELVYSSSQNIVHLLEVSWNKHQILKSPTEGTNDTQDYVS